MWAIFRSVTYFSICDPGLQVWAPFIKGTNSLSVTRFSECDPFFQVRPIFYVWPTFSSVTQFFKDDLIV